MTTEVATVNETWTNLTTGLSLTNGQIYLLSNNGSRRVYINEQASAPTGDPEGHILNPQEKIQYTQRSGLTLFAITVYGEATVAATEAN